MLNGCEDNRAHRAAPAGSVLRIAKAYRGLQRSAYARPIMPRPHRPQHRRSVTRQPSSLGRRIGNSFMGSALNQMTAAILAAYLIAAVFLHRLYGVAEPVLWVIGAFLVIVLFLSREHLFRAFARRRRR
jgi:hypothetical protein